jgi:hypothetical protein
MLGTILCWVGIHKWATKSVRVFDVLYTYNRCTRPGCPRYSEWENVEMRSVRSPW